MQVTHIPSSPSYEFYLAFGIISRHPSHLPAEEIVSEREKGSYHMHELIHVHKTQQITEP